MTWEPLVTVVTPSFNYGRFIGDCLESVRSQTYPHIEHLVMDACSSDETAGILSRSSGSYGLIVVSEKDAGQANALNKGFARAQGEVFCWLNADDYWLHDRVVEEAVRALAGADLVAAGGRYVDETGVLLRPIRLDPLRAIAEMGNYSTLLQPATFWRRSVHSPLHEDLHYAFDWRLFLDIKARARGTTVLDEEWAAFRWHGVSKSATDPADRRREIAAILRDQWGTWSLHHLWGRSIFVAYRLSELTHVPLFRWGVEQVNRVIRARKNMTYEDPPKRGRPG